MSDHTKFLIVAEEAVRQLRRFQGQYPHLTTPEVNIAVEQWGKFKQIRGSLDISSKKEKTGQFDNLSKMAVELMHEHQIEDAMEILAERFSMELDYKKFIGLIGKERYRGALRHEARDLRSNAISFQQMADLWNSMGKPALGGERWTAHSVSLLAE